MRTLCLLALLVVSAAPAQAQRPGVNPPPDRITTSERFDAGGIRAYRGSHEAVYAYIDRHTADHVAQLQRWVRQPSISAENRGVQEMAALLRDDLRLLGFQEAEVVPTSGHPGVWGFYDAGAAQTLVVYMMYDVQPIEPADWQVDPFAGELVDHAFGRALMARGAVNQKGPQRAFLNAVESILAVHRTLPVNLMVLAEGEEELGSPHYPELIARFRERLQTADGVLFPSASQSPRGEAGFSLGVKGIVYFELESTGGAWGGPKDAEVHGSNKARIGSPVWRLAQALASLTTPDGDTIVVPGYYDAIRPPNAEEQRLFNAGLESAVRNDSVTRQVLAVDRWAGGLDARGAYFNMLFNTTLNIDGIWGGYTGEGVKTILPHRATAKLDSRLVPNQTPDDALRLIRAHLDAQGFGDVVIRKLAGYPPAQVSVDAPLVRAAIGVFRKHGRPPNIGARTAGSAPYYVFTDLGLPLVSAGLGHGSGAHAPNEYLVVEPKAETGIAGLAEMEKFYVDLLYALAEAR
ncbi:MAG TPA: M20/M25/M40 family metallo-hydrolase [Gemmatimonadaceae bacterium]|nr:M20/M25/M40 family metallo-hydrolase [Gemmatimonadaceae bacterium]